MAATMGIMMDVEKDMGINKQVFQGVPAGSSNIS